MQRIKEQLKHQPTFGDFQPVNIIFSDTILFEDKTQEFLDFQFDVKIKHAMDRQREILSPRPSAKQIQLIEEEPTVEPKIRRQDKVSKKELKEKSSVAEILNKTQLEKIEERQENQEEEEEEEIEPPHFITEEEELEYNNVTNIVDFIKRNQNDRRLNIENVYYLNNRKRFIDFIQRVFQKYKTELDEHSKPSSCDTISSTNKLSLLIHQKLITDYLNMYTPYRGLLLFHGLGSGKTCSSIAIAENFKNANKNIIVMTPASLKPNFMKEIKKCGNFIYRLNNQWIWKSADQLQGKHAKLEQELNLPIGYIKKQNGIWVMEPEKTKASRKHRNNIANRSAKHTLDEQITLMIQQRYQHISYNGLRKSHIKRITEDGTVNPFDNKVVIVDEAHKFISPIVNKLKAPLKKKDNQGVAISLYELLLKAKNARIILLTGTPIMNYPNELAILFNMIRGYITTYELKLNIVSSERITNDILYNKLSQTDVGKHIDFFQYSPSNKVLTITRNPFYFLNRLNSRGNYAGVKLDRNAEERPEEPPLSDDEFISNLITELSSIGAEVESMDQFNYKNLPDNFDSFMTRFYSGTELVNKEQLSNRLVGLTSYFSGTPELLPRYKKDENYHIVPVPMSDYQFEEYKKERAMEQDSEKTMRKRKALNKDMFSEQPSTYRIFSRLYCNFAMPENMPRPKPRMFDEIKESEEKKMEEETTQEEKPKGVKAKTRKNKGSVEEENTEEPTEFEDSGDHDADESLSRDKRYAQEIQNTLNELAEHSEQLLSPAGLEMYSPKYLSIINNIQSPDHIGLHLVYSQFRSMEGIGIFCLALNQNGFAEFKIEKNSSGKWIIAVKEEDYGKPKYALYTGKESKEVKEIIMNIYNGFFDLVPRELSQQLSTIAPNNNLGEIIKIFMITASGAEGLDLKNTRYVHIMEPFWNFVRVEQVIGRAVRICSHKNLPEELKNVEAFVYLSVFSPDQLKDNKKSEVLVRDMGSIIKKPLTTDEYLYEMSMRKEKAISQLIQTIKETSIDCSVYPNNRVEGIECYDPKTTSLEFSYNPNIEKDINASVKKTVA
jgi:hypothetical protein